METEGPPLEILLRRIAEVPPDFLAEPRIGESGTVVVAAVVQDLAEAFSLRFSDKEMEAFVGAEPKRDAPKLSMALLLAWTIAEDSLRSQKPTAKTLWELLCETGQQLAQQAAPAKYVRDPDRREELARLALAGLGLRPAGESKAQAQDRLTSISGVERNRVLKASRAAEERARAIREALAKKAAQESADKWTRE